jgi:hypothetical protein
MRRPFILFGLSGDGVADASIPDGEVASSISEADNSSGSTAITMYAAADESWGYNT